MPAAEFAGRAGVPARHASEGINGCINGVPLYPLSPNGGEGLGEGEVTFFPLPLICGNAFTGFATSCFKSPFVKGGFRGIFLRSP